MRVGIIGAGVAGLTVAARLVEAGHSALVLDKGRGVGGRTSTRRGEGVTFDHGAQYYTVREPRFQAFLDDRVPTTDRAAWEARFATLDGGRLVPEASSHPRFVGVPGMAAIARAMAKGLDVRTEIRVIRLVGSPGGWTLVGSEGQEHGPFDWVVATAPPVQTAALLEGSSPIAAEADVVVMQPCFTLMIAPSNGATLPADFIRCQHPILGSAANNHTKPGRSTNPALVIQSNHDWASAHVQDDLAYVARALREAASEAFDVDLGPIGSESVHRWLYAKPVEPLGRPCLVDDLAQVAACGDWCLAGKIEGAFLSGEACAAALIAR